MTRIIRVLVERDVPKMFFVARVVADFPTETFIGDLVREANLPERNRDGKALMYALMKVESGEVIGRRATLLESGVEAGARLRLKEVEDPSLMLPYQRVSRGRGRVGFSPGATTIADGQGFVWEGTGREENGREKGRMARRAVLGLLVVGAVGGTMYGFTGGGLRGLGNSLGGMMSGQRVGVMATPKPTRAVSPPIQPVSTYGRHQARVQTVAWSQDSTMVASGDEMGRVYVWRVDGQSGRIGDTVFNFPQALAVHAVRWSLGQKRLAVCTGNDFVIYDGRNGNLIVRYQGVHAPEASDMVWVNAPGALAVSVGYDKRAVVWNTQQYRVDLIYAESGEELSAICATADGKCVYMASLGGIVRCWNPATGQDVHGYYQDGTKPLRAIACSAVTGQVVVGGDDGVARAWAGLVCRKDGLECMDQPQRVKVSGATIQGVTWSKDGKTVALGCSDGTLALWRPIETNVFFQQKLGGEIGSVNWSPDGRHVAVAVEKQVMVWKVV